jgi:hypothetical protein
LAFRRLRFLGAAAALRFFALFAIFASFQIEMRRYRDARWWPDFLELLFTADDDEVEDVGINSERLSVDVLAGFEPFALIPNNPAGGPARLP